jgi:predicted transcriptional regulator of viral defense system
MKVEENRTTRPRATGVPPELATFPLRTFQTSEARAAYSHPAPQLRRLANAGVVHHLAHGYYAVVPQDEVAQDWMPILEVAAAGIAAACFRGLRAPLMGVSAARMHGALPRALGTALVAAPVQHEPIALLDRPAIVRFIKRDTSALDVETVSTELGRVLVTSIEQTVLDLARRPPLNVAEDQIPEALRALLLRADEELLQELALQQRLRSALGRVRTLVAE